MRKYWYATLAVLAHPIAVFWHLEPVARLGGGLRSDQAPLFVGLANIIPLPAMLSLWAHYPKAGAGLLLFFGRAASERGIHFLSPASENAFQMAPGESNSAFRASPELLFALEFVALGSSV
jgi:hypothetical protein